MVATGQGAQHLVLNSTASADLQVLDGPVFSVVGSGSFESHTLPASRGNRSLSMASEMQHVDGDLQYGFKSAATDFAPSDVLHDNLVLDESVTLGDPRCTGSPNTSGPAARIAVGSSRSSQVWFRDPGGAPRDTTISDGFRLTFRP